MTTVLAWLRTNRWWLPLLPVCLVAMTAASGYRVKQLYYDAGLHHVQATGRPGHYLTTSFPYDDAFGHTRRTFSVRFDGLVRASVISTFGDTDPVAPPAGAEVLEAHFDWKADPEQSLSGCVIALVDSKGRRYELPQGAAQYDLCVPQDKEGPEPADTSTGQKRGYVEKGHRRQPTWSKAVRFIVPDGVRITQAYVYWYQGIPDYPDYVVLPVPMAPIPLAAFPR